MNEFITGASGFGASNREIDHQGPAHNVGPGYKPPVTAVQTIVTIVAHHKIVVRRHHQLAAIYVVCKFIPPMAVNVPGIAAQTREVIAISIWYPLLMHRVIFLERTAIDIDYFVPKADVIARHSDHPFYQKLRCIYRKIENYN